MGLDIGNFLFNSIHQILFVEAPVGTGKSLGVLIPSLIYAQNKKVNITYATATRNLQEQIINQEVPRLEGMHLLRKETTILTMGKSNYACLQSFYHNKSKFNPPRRRDQIKKALLECKTGSRNELESHFNINFSDDEWKLISLDKASNHCVLNKCSAHQYRKLFMQPHKITVTNHDQLIQSYLNVQADKKPIIPINSGVIIIDEAHLFQDSYLSHVQSCMALNQFNALRGVSNHITRKLLSNLNKYIKKITKNPYGKSNRYDIPEQVRNDLLKLLIELQKGEEIKINNGHLSSSLESRNQEIMDFIVKICTKDKYTSWISIDGIPQLNSIPNTFFKDIGVSINDLAKNNKIILLSGTLTTTDQPKEELTHHWTIHRIDYKKYETPFQASKQVYLYIPKDLTVQNNPNYITDVSSTLRDLTSINNGGTLLLSNSLETLDKLKTKISHSFNSRNVLYQGEKTTAKLTKTFKTDTSSILIGSGSFYSGFSIPGNALENVLIASLPFPVPNDPFIELQKKTFNVSNDDFDIILGMMLKRLEQGMGRLIRKKTDSGIICITDSRIYTKDYGKIIQNWLKKQNFQLHDSLQGIDNFIQKNKQYLNDMNNQTEASFDLNDLNIPTITQ